LSEKKRKTKARPGNGGSGGGKSEAGGRASGEAGPMNVGFLQQLVDLMSANDLNTVDLRESGRRIILKRGAAQVAMGTAPVQHVSHAMQSTPSPTAKPLAGGGAGGRAMTTPA
jgi:hypothetical protein